MPRVRSASGLWRFIRLGELAWLRPIHLQGRAPSRSRERAGCRHSTLRQRSQRDFEQLRGVTSATTRMQTPRAYRVRLRVKEA